MQDKAPRKLFGLLCAHRWHHTGYYDRKWVSGRTQQCIVLTCEHCGDIKVVKP